MRRIVSALKYSVLSIVLLTGCSGEAVEWVDWPIVPGAKNIQNYNLKTDNAHQISFDLHAEYPSKKVAEFYEKEIKSPWIRCYQEMEWQSFGDATQTPPAFIHQMLLHWADFKNNRLLLLGVRYVSDGGDYQRFPNTQIQNVYLVEYHEVGIETAVGKLGLNCERT